MTVRILLGDCRSVLKTLPDESVHCVVTSPPYLGLRDYGIPGSVWDGDPACAHEWGEAVINKAASYKEGSKARWNHRKNGRGEEQAHMVDRAGWERKEIKQGSFCQCGAWRGALGLEPTPHMYVEHLVEVFREVRRVLREDGTLWLNLGDSYAGSGRGGHVSDTSTLQGSIESEQQCRIARGSQRPPGLHAAAAAAGAIGRAWVPPPRGLKQKDLVGTPWMLAFALRADGWYLRQDIIWSKPNPMPESVRDRCTKAHEYIFLLAKSERYYFDALAIREPATDTGRENGREGRDEPEEARPPGSNPRTLKRLDYTKPRKVKIPGGWDRGPGAHGTIHREGRTEAEYQEVEIAGGRNKRSVWTVPTKGYPDAHFATFPPDLIEPCILAGCPIGGTVLDPFAGAFTTALVAERYQRNSIAIELNPSYVEMGKRRLMDESSLFTNLEIA